MIAPRLLLILALVGLSVGAHAGTETAPSPDLPGIKARVPLGPDAEPAFRVSAPTAAALEKIGWKVDKEGGLVRAEGADKGVIPKSYLVKAKLEWKAGALAYSNSPEAVPLEMLAPILKGLSSFTAAAKSIAISSSSR